MGGSGEPTGRAGDEGWVTVIVPARDEARVIADVIADLGRQDHRLADGSPRFDVVVVDDRSSDGTGALAEAALRRNGLAETSCVVRRYPPAADGKGAALASVPLGSIAGTSVVVLDADARIDPGFVRRAAALVSAGVPVATARRRMLTPAGGRLARVLAEIQDDEQTLDAEIQLGRWALGGASELRGDGMVIHRDLLEAVGGWPVDALCEDLELSTRLAAATGRGVRPSSDLVVWEEPVVCLRALIRQRLRWAEGEVRRDAREAVPLLLGGAAGRQHLDVAAYLAQSLAPLAALGMVMAPGGRRRLAGLVGAYSLGLGALAFDSLRWSPTSAGRPPGPAVRVVRAARVVAFTGLWLLVLPIAHVRVVLRRGPLRFDKTEHLGGMRRPAEGADA